MGSLVFAGRLTSTRRARGPKFDHVIDEVFAAQLNGRGKTPEDRIKMLRKLSGIKEVPKKKEKEKKPAKGGEKHVAAETVHPKQKTTAEKGAATAKFKAGMKAAAARKKSKK